MKMDLRDKDKNNSRKPLYASMQNTNERAFVNSQKSGRPPTSRLPKKPKDMIINEMANNQSVSRSNTSGSATDRNDNRKKFVNAPNEINVLPNSTSQLSMSYRMQSPSVIIPSNTSEFSHPKASEKHMMSAPRASKKEGTTYDDHAHSQSDASSLPSNIQNSVKPAAKGYNSSNKAGTLPLR